MRPMRIPPSPWPNQASELASAGIERAPPTSAAMGLSAITTIHGEPKESVMMPSAMLVTIQDDFDSIDGAVNSDI